MVNCKRVLGALGDLVRSAYTSYFMNAIHYDPMVTQSAWKKSRKVRGTGSSSCQNAPSAGRKCLQRFELCIHGPKKSGRNLSKKSPRTGNSSCQYGPSAGRKRLQRFELCIHGLKKWSRNFSKEVRERRSSISQERSEWGQACWQRFEGNRSPPPTRAGARWPSRNLPRRTALVHGRGRY